MDWIKPVTSNLEKPFLIKNDAATLGLLQYEEELEIQNNKAIRRASKAAYLANNMPQNDLRLFCVNPHLDPSGVPSELICHTIWPAPPGYPQGERIDTRSNVDSKPQMHQEDLVEATEAVPCLSTKYDLDMSCDELVDNYKEAVTYRRISQVKVIQKIQRDSAWKSRKHQSDADANSNASAASVPHHQPVKASGKVSKPSGSDGKDKTSRVPEFLPTTAILPPRSTASRHPFHIVKHILPTDQKTSGKLEAQSSGGCQVTGKLKRETTSSPKELFHNTHNAPTATNPQFHCPQQTSTYGEALSSRSYSKPLQRALSLQRTSWNGNSERKHACRPRHYNTPCHSIMFRRHASEGTATDSAAVRNKQLVPSTATDLHSKTGHHEAKVLYRPSGTPGFGKMGYGRAECGRAECGSIHLEKKGLPAVEHYGEIQGREQPGQKHQGQRGSTTKTQQAAGDKEDRLPRQYLGSTSPENLTTAKLISCQDKKGQFLPKQSHSTPTICDQRHVLVHVVRIARLPFFIERTVSDADLSCGEEDEAIIMMPKGFRPSDSSID